MAAGSSRTRDLRYWADTGVVFGSNVAAIELLQSCLANKVCYQVPPRMRSRAAMYGVGLSMATGVSFVTYYMKKRGNRWWLVPGTLATTFNLVFVVGAAERLNGPQYTNNLF
jgi:hypothetical protein